jgi:hypothetical protein
MDSILVNIGAGLTILWGISHLFPTKSVVAGFGEIGEDNKQIITMEWINEGVTLIFIGVLVATVTFLDPDSTATFAVYLVSIICLLTLALISLFTGFKIKFLPYKLCPIIFSLSAVLIFLGGIL